ncbi:cellulose synthase-like protein D5 isoform X1 [Impatiens glandulifera]|uniref:cellulose synthase-like protein D5 isoform X1 n=1 Tax=Impatiens glandulifera TaxID=253017 RepID=UPI001FB164F1|nr:cellulose synthase-like protein D5 isoform X1 [Impatiens glandulifera]
MVKVISHFSIVISGSNNVNSPLSGNRGQRASSGGGGGSRLLSVSKDTDEFVAYTVHIPPTPDRGTTSESQNSPLESRKSAAGGPHIGSYVKDTLYTGGFNSVTRAHVIDSSINDGEEIGKSELICEIEGCDDNAQDKNWKGQCECGFRIWKDCYLDCISNGTGYCNGCKEAYKDLTDYETSESSSSDTENLLILL